MKEKTALYIGTLSEGSTSRMRAVSLQELTPGCSWSWVDTSKPLQQAVRWLRSLAFRCKAGPVLKDINQLVMAAVVDHRYDLVWVDKGVFLWAETVAGLRAAAGKLVHFTPDCAFLCNQSRHFNRSILQYDLLVTTKSFEVMAYAERALVNKVHLTTQGYNKALHFPRPGLRAKGAVFVGLCEPDREACIQALLEAGVPVKLGGKGWERMVKKWHHSPMLDFVGSGVFGEAYASLYSSSWIGLGLLSKRFPELHTTRTFEIPACGAILATERNVETERFFEDGEVLFFSDHADLALKVKELLAGPEEDLLQRALAGCERVNRSGRDYDSLLREILVRVWAEVDLNFATPE